jgi:alpha-amylase
MYFQVHQPYRLRHYTYFDIGQQHYYHHEGKNREILLKVAEKCYRPTNAILLELIRRYKGAFKVAFSLSGVIIEQFKRYSPETLDSFKRLVDTGHVELLSETYYHSLSCLFSKKEFEEQVLQHKALIKKEFGYTPTTFRNTELIYKNELATWVADLGYNTILAEGAEKVLGWRSANFVYRPPNENRIKLLLRNYSLSDDISFRFSEKSWSDYPLNADKFAHWLHSNAHHASIINLFMDYETFGEHQWADTGIFEFLRYLPECVFKHPDFKFIMPCEAHHLLEPVDTLDVHHPLSWADVDRDLSAWYENPLQKDALNAVYGLEPLVKELKDPDMISTWRSLTTSDHFYYMCTKFSADGDVHKYFSAYDNPYDAYINFQNIISDFSLELKKKKENMPTRDTEESRKFILEGNNPLIQKGQINA